MAEIHHQWLKFTTFILSDAHSTGNVINRLGLELVRLSKLGFLAVIGTLSTRNRRASMKWEILTTRAMVELLPSADLAQIQHNLDAIRSSVRPSAYDR